MNVRYLIGCIFGSVVAFAACGSDDKGNGDNGAGAAGSGAAGSSGAATGGSSTGGTTTTGGTGGTGGGAVTGCDLAPCSGITFLNQPLAACCISTMTCGVDVLGTCTDPSALMNMDAGASEVIVSDPVCVGTSFNAMGFTVELPGCCDPSGVCGLSTENIASQLGGLIPVQCLTAQEAQQQYMQTVPDAGPPVPCNYPGDGGTLPDSGTTTPDSGTGDGSANTDASASDGG